MSRFHEGDRVTTPDGPGFYVNTYRGRDRYETTAWREFLIVQLDPDPSYERPRPKLLSLDGVGGADDRLGETLAALDGDHASGRDPDLRGLLAERDRTRVEDLDALGL